jgi:hypothetical protein
MGSRAKPLLLTKEATQAKYPLLVLGKTKIAIYGAKLPISKWLESL